MPERAYGRRADLCLIAFVMAVSFVAILRVGLAPRDAASGVAVIYAPGTTAAETVVRSVGAGARFVRFGGFDFIAIVMPEAPDYVQRETRRAVDDVAGKPVHVWPGIDIDVPVPAGASKCTAAGVRDAVLAAFRDQVLYLKHNLNARAIGSLKGTSASINTDVTALIASIDISMQEADKLISSLSTTDTN